MGRATGRCAPRCSPHPPILPTSFYSPHPFIIIIIIPLQVYGGKVGVVGEAAGLDLTYPYEHLGDGLSALTNSNSSTFFKGASNPMVIVGSTVFRDPAAMAKVRDFAAKAGVSVSVLHDCASAVGALLDLDVAAGGLAQAALGRPADHARGAGALRERLHHLHAYRLHEPVGAGDQRSTLAGGGPLWC